MRKPCFQPEDLLPELRIDAEIPLSSVTPELLENLGRLEPFGHGNREPVFSSSGVNLLMPPRILKEKHIKLRVNQRLPNTKPSFNYEAVGWRMAEPGSGGSPAGGRESGYGLSR